MPSNKSRKRVAASDEDDITVLQPYKRTPPPDEVHSNYSETPVFPYMQPMYHSTPHIEMSHGQMFMPHIYNMSPIEHPSFCSPTEDSRPGSEHAELAANSSNSTDEIHRFGMMSVEHKVNEMYNTDLAHEYQKQPVMNGKKEVFCSVPGRLSLMGNGGKYDVTVDEIKRRLGTPECLNSSILAAILRKAKTANNGQGMRRELDAAGIVLPVGRRKQGVTTACTALLEDEAMHLASDVDKLTRAHYPFAALTEHLRARGEMRSMENVEEKRRDLMGAVRVLSELGEVLRAVDCPLGENNNPTPFHDNMLQGGMNTYSMYTHGFGIFNQRTWVGAFETLARNWLRALPPPPVVTSYETMLYSNPSTVLDI